MDLLDIREGFYRVAGAIPQVEPGNPDYNIERIVQLSRQADKEGVRIIVFPELSLTGYTCGDLFNQQLLLSTSHEALIQLAKHTEDLNLTLIIGAPIQFKNALYNCAIVVSQGKIIGIVPKIYIPNYSEFYEKRWFKSGESIIDETIKINKFSVPFSRNLIFRNADGITFGVEICEDLWVTDSPSRLLTREGAEIIFNLSATDEILGKHYYLRTLIEMQSASCRCAYVYSSAGAFESSTDLVFSGNAIIAEDGKILKESQRFLREEQIISADIDIERLRHDRRVYNSFSDNLSNDPQTRLIKISELTAENNFSEINLPHNLLHPVEPLPFVPSNPEHLRENCEEIISIQSWGLEQRLLATGCRNLVIGISGGLDSTLALLVACHAFDKLNLPRKGIHGITMPGKATTSRTHNNAWSLMKELGVTALEIPIGESVSQHFKDIGQNPACYDATYENSQARERTQILMDMANKVGGMVLGTGDLSELALGWCTYNGDHMSMYAVNASIPKTLIKHLVKWFAECWGSENGRKTLLDIIDTPISPELIPSGKEDTIAQKTEDLVGPYQLHDFFLFHTLRNGSRPSRIFFLANIAFEGVYDKSTIKKWLKNFYRRFFNQQFKRSCMPDGPKVGSVCLSPRGDWRMPSDATSSLWLKEVENL